MKKVKTLIVKSVAILCAIAVLTSFVLFIFI